MSSVEAMVKSKIEGKKVMVFSKSYCPFCTKAKKVFQKYLENGTLTTDDYEVMEIENNKDCDAIQNYLNQITGARSVPRVFVKKECIGGGDDVAKLDNSKQLAKLLES